MLKPATKKQFLDGVAKHPGVEWEFDGAGHLVVDAPPRHIFRGIGTHAIVASADETTRQEQYAQAIDDMRGGVRAMPGP